MGLHLCCLYPYNTQIVITHTHTHSWLLQSMRAKNEYGRMIKKEQRNSEKNITNKTGENPKLFHKFSRSHLSDKKVLIRLRDS